MKARIVDLRYKMKNILRALDRNEHVTVLYHGKEKAVISPLYDYPGHTTVTRHPFFGMKTDTGESVEETMERLRGERY